MHGNVFYHINSIAGKMQIENQNDILFHTQENDCNVKRLAIPNAEEGVEKLKLLYTTEHNVKECNHFRKFLSFLGS